MALSLNGLASGLDTEAIVGALMQLQQSKVTAVQRRQVTVQQHKDDLNAIKTKLDAVKTAAQALSDPLTWKAKQTTTSSDPSKVEVAILGGAGIGGKSIEVLKLASSAQRGFSFTPSATAGTLSITANTSGATPFVIDVPADATAADIAAKVNANENAPVYAAVVKENGEDRIVFSSRTTGASSDFTVDTSGLAGGQMAEIPAYARTGAAMLDAQYRLDGDPTVLTSESNVIENAIPGVRLTLKGITSSPVTVTTTQATIDTEEITKKITALVDAYNAVVTATRAELTEKRVVGATTSSDLQKGTLFGDTGLTSMLSQLKAQMTQTVQGLGLTGLADIGIGVPKATGGAVSEDAKAGKLTIDTEKLTEALNADYTKVRELFTGQGATKGLSGLIGDYVSSQTGTNGMLKSRMDSDDQRLKSFTDQITKLEERMALEEKRLKAQFAAMEAALNASQTQQAWLTSAIASLPSLA